VQSSEQNLKITASKGGREGFFWQKKPYLLILPLDKPHGMWYT